MAAPKGNQFWKIRSKHGREKLFATPALLWEAVQEYFEWCDDHPWNKKEAVKGGDLAGTVMDVPTERPYTLSGLCLYLDASERYWGMFRSSANEDFLRVITRTEEIIRTQKFEGAAVGAFNANIISRDLGLTDKQEVATVKKVYKVKITNGGG